MTEIILPKTGELQQQASDHIDKRIASGEEGVMDEPADSVSRTARLMLSLEPKAKDVLQGLKAVLKEDSQ